MNIDQIGKTLIHWSGFQENIGRSFMMNEDALKYPLADFLFNQGGATIDNVHLEHVHPKFPSRRIDLVVKESGGHFNSSFEFKLATKYTRTNAEKQRIFDDLMRLFFLAEGSRGSKFFIIIGKTIHFMRDFQQFPNTEQAYYQEWFSFTAGEQKVISLRGAKAQEYTDVYQDFSKRYLQDLPESITTECKFITGFGLSHVPYMVGIWTVT